MSEPVIDVSSLTRRFGGRTALDSVSLSMPRGAVYGLIGANGAGKPTLIKHLLGLLRAESGSVRVFGLDPVADPDGVLSRIGYLSEENDLAAAWIATGLCRGRLLGDGRSSPEPPAGSSRWPPSTVRSRGLPAPRSSRATSSGSSRPWRSRRCASGWRRQRSRGIGIGEAAVTMATTRGKRALGAVLALIGLPLVLVLAEAVSFRVRNRNNGTIVTSGQKREYLLHPSGAKPGSGVVTTRSWGCAANLVPLPPGRRADHPIHPVHLRHPGPPPLRGR